MATASPGISITETDIQVMRVTGCPRIVVKTPWCVNSSGLGDKGWIWPIRAHIIGWCDRFSVKTRACLYVAPYQTRTVHGTSDGESLANTLTFVDVVDLRHRA